MSTLFIGLDAMDIDIVDSLIAAGELPTLAALRTGWHGVPTTNPVGLLVGGLWPSFWSQSDVSHHGSYCWRQVVPGTYSTAKMLPVDFDAEPFWLDLDRRGYRYAVLDMPLIRPIPLDHGVVTVCWGDHDAQLPASVLPESFAHRISRFGDYPQRSCDRTVAGGGHGALVDALHRGIDLRMQVLREVLDDGFDLVATVFPESHCAGHHLVHLHDPAHPAYDPSLAQRLGGDPLADVYRHLDAAVGSLLQAAGPDTAVMVLLSHGIGAHNDGGFLLPEILERLESRFPAAAPVVRVRERVLQPVRGARRRLARRLRPNSPHLRSVRNLDGTKPWFEIPNNEFNAAIRLNLRGREPWGRIRPGAEMDRVVDMLRTELLALRHCDSGAPAVLDVISADDHYSGPRRSSIPDLFVVWNTDEPFTAVTSPTIGEVRTDRTYARTGDHRPRSMVLTRNIPPVEPQVPIHHLAAALVSSVRATAPES